MADDPNPAPETNPFGGPGAEPAPAQAPAQPPAGPKLVEVNISGQTVQLPEETARAIEAYQTTTSRELQSLAAQVAALQEPPKPKDPAPEPDFDSLLFEQPTQALDRYFETRVLPKIDERIQTARTEVQAATTADRFWRDFYGDNPALKAWEPIVQACLQRDYNELEKLEPAKAAEKLAERVSKQLIDNGVRLGKPGAESAPRVEGASPSSAPAPAPESGTGEVVSLGAVLRKRREARRAATNRTGSTG